MASAAVLVGISGPSSSGKTTLSRLLRDIFPKTSVLHLDDFYYPDAQIPIRDGVQDWDCVESLDLDNLRRVLAHIKSHGTTPPDFVSKEDQNAIGSHGVPEPTIQQCKDRVRDLVKRETWERPVVIVDGFLLFSESMADIRQLFDVKIFLRTPYETVKTRREARRGYVTIEGFWEDPPGYVDRIVWPNYVKDHAFLFREGNVHGALDKDKCKSLGIDGMPAEAQESMAHCLMWAVEVLEGFVKRASQRDSRLR